AGFKSLKDSWADTTTAHGRLMLTILGGLAEFERELIRARTGEGRKRAKARGVRFGRPRKMTPHQRQEALQRLHAGETMAEVARTYAVDGATISRLAAHSPFERSAADVGSDGPGNAHAGSGLVNCFPRGAHFRPPRSFSTASSSTTRASRPASVRGRRTGRPIPGAANQER